MKRKDRRIANDGVGNERESEDGMRDMWRASACLQPANRVRFSDECENSEMRNRILFFFIYIYIFGRLFTINSL